ncbi:MAG: hypothetical protein K8T20_15240 [Planctomycetes bacterium]|nr:hypothetical protein [Planctomycetota bacterium]
MRLPKFVGSPSPVIIEPEDRAQPLAPLAHWECACFSGIMFALNRLEIYDCLVSVVGIYGCLNYGESDAVALASVKAVYNAMSQVQTPPGSASKDWMIVDT